jgi:hypothetical protein
MKTLIVKSIKVDSIECKLQILMTLVWSQKGPKPQVDLSFSWEL